MMQGNWGNGFSNCFNGFYGWHMVTIIGVVVLIIGLIWWQASKKGSNNQSAITLLEERFVQGDITAEEFTAKKDMLKGK